MAVEIERISNRQSEGTKIALGKSFLIESPAGLLEIAQTKEGFEIRRADSHAFVLKYVSGETLKIKNQDGSSTVYHAYSEEDMRARDLLEPML